MRLDQTTPNTDQLIGATWRSGWLGERPTTITVALPSPVSHALRRGGTQVLVLEHQAQDTHVCARPHAVLNRVLAPLTQPSEAAIQTGERGFNRLIGAPTLTSPCRSTSRPGDNTRNHNSDVELLPSHGAYSTRCLARGCSSSILEWHRRDSGTHT